MTFERPAPGSRKLDLSILALLAANAIPLVGVLAWGWDAARIVFLYWFENVVIGGINVLKILMAAGVPPDPGGKPDTSEEVENLRRFQHASKVFLVPFFLVHYGLFTFVHGVFLFVLFSQAGKPPGDFGNPFTGLPAMVAKVLAGGGGWAALALVTSHLYSFGANFVAGGEWRRKSAMDLMGEPYGRVVVLHLAILFGGLAVQFLGNPLPLLVLLVIGKTVLDLAFHRRAHGGTAGKAATSRA